MRGVTPTGSIVTTVSQRSTINIQCCSAVSGQSGLTEALSFAVYTLLFVVRNGSQTVVGLSGM